MRFDWNYRISPLNEECILYLFPTIYYQMEKYGNWRWHSLNVAWFNFSVSVEVDTGGTR